MDDLRAQNSSTESTLESVTLLNEIYANISSQKAVFDGPFGLRSVIYCDYAASGQPLNFIEDYIKEEVLPFYGNTHTTITSTSLQSTSFRDEAKDIIRKAVNASEHDAVIFTGNGCTSAVSKLIHAMNLKQPAVVFVGPFEHHSNLLPWREMNSKTVRIKETVDGCVDLNCLESEMKKYCDKNYQLIGSFSAASNITGILTDDISISILLHKYGALSIWDYATAAPYVRIDMNPIVIGQNEGMAYKDAVFISPHKFVGGPGTPGILVAKKALFKNPIPSEPGGGTIVFVTRSTHHYLKDIEEREEGGTPSIVGAIRAGMVFQLKEAIGHSVIIERERQICSLVFSRWKNIPELHILGSSSVPRLAIFSFVIQHTESGLYLHHNFVCSLLNDLFGIQTRSGCACAGPYALDLLGIEEPLALRFSHLLAEKASLDRSHMRGKDEHSAKEAIQPGFTRLTLPFFMLESDLNFVLEAVALVAKQGWKLLPQYIFNPKSGEWKLRKCKINAKKNYNEDAEKVFLSRKSLGSISYKTGHFVVKESNRIHGKPKKPKELLDEAREIFQNSVEVSTKEFIPDKQLNFDAESSELRWFLLPSEAKQYILGENVEAKKTVFTLRNSSRDSNLCKVNANNLPHSSTWNSVGDVYCNFTGCKGAISMDAVSLNRNINSSRLSNQSSPVIKRNALQKNLYTSVFHKWHSPPTNIFRPFMKAVSQFEMIKNGDKVLVCLSGGKDSLSLLHTLHQFQFYARKQGICFEIGAVTVDPKSSHYDPSLFKEYFKALNVPYFYEEQDIVEQVTKMEKCTPICTNICCHLKRGRIYACALRQNYNVVALGQHIDDLAESFLMSIFHNGRLRTMRATYTNKSSSLRIIRPFAFVREKNIRTFAEKKKLSVVPQNYPACFEAQKERQYVQHLLSALELQFPNLYLRLSTAMHPLMAINLAGGEDKVLKRMRRKKSLKNWFLKKKKLRSSVTAV